MQLPSVRDAPSSRAPTGAPTLPHPRPLHCPDLGANSRVPRPRLHVAIWFGCSHQRFAKCDQVAALGGGAGRVMLQEPFSAPYPALDRGWSRATLDLNSRSIDLPADRAQARGDPRGQCR